MIRIGRTPTFQCGRTPTQGALLGEVLVANDGVTDSAMGFPPPSQPPHAPPPARHGGSSPLPAGSAIREGSVSMTQAMASLR